MPRKYQDNQLVAVYYSTRRMHARFLGVVQKYDRGETNGTSGKYYVRYVSGEKSFPHDKVFECHTRELCVVTNEFVDEMKASQLQVYHNAVRTNVESVGRYNDTLERRLWTSFAAKRSQTYEWHRTFPETQIVWRTAYVY